MRVWIAGAGGWAPAGCSGSHACEIAITNQYPRSSAAPHHSHSLTVMHAWAQQAGRSCSASGQPPAPRRRQRRRQASPRARGPRGAAARDTRRRGASCWRPVRAWREEEGVRLVGRSGPLGVALPSRERLSRNQEEMLGLLRRGKGAGAVADAAGPHARAPAPHTPALRRLGGGHRHQRPGPRQNCLHVGRCGCLGLLGWWSSSRGSSGASGWWLEDNVLQLRV